MHHCISLLDKGNYWEKAIEFCRESRHSHVKNVKLTSVTGELRKRVEQNRDYASYVSLLEQEASFWEKIKNISRFPPEYFRVGFYGKGFPPNLEVRDLIENSENILRKFREKSLCTEESR